MRKYFGLFFAMFVLVGCGGYVKNENGSENLKKLEHEPVGCVFLYKIESTASVYNQDDAYRYLENRIAEQSNSGNVYWIVNEKIKSNPGAIFGPKNSFIFAANVYDCPNPEKVKTK